MYVLLEGLRKIALHLWPVMPGASERMLAQLGAGFDPGTVDLDRERGSWQGLAPQTAVSKKSNLFPRVDLTLEMPGDDKSPRQEQRKKRKDPEVQFEDFQKLKMVTGKIIKAEKVEGADKLYKLEVEIGEESPRQIVAGLAGFFSIHELVGTEVVVLANLAPRKIRGVMSRGMVLAVRQGSGMSLLRAYPGAEPGSRIT